MIRDIIISRGPIAAFCAVGLYWGAFAALVPDLKPQIGLSDGDFGLALLVSSVGALAAMWAAPALDARMGRRGLPLMTVALGALFVLPGMVWNWLTFSVAMTLAAAASGTLDVAMNARLAVLEERSRRSLMNLNHGMFSVAYAVSALGTGLAREAGWTPFEVFVALGGLTLLLAWQTWAAPVPDAEPDAAEPVGVRQPWGLLVPLGLIVLLGFLAEQSTEGWSALHLERGLGAGAAMGALGPAILGVTMAIGRLSGQVVAQWMSEARVIRWAAVLTALGAIVAAWAPGLGVAYVGFAMLGLGVSVVAPMALAWTGRMVPGRRKAVAISRVTVIGSAGFLIGPPMMGGLSEMAGLSASFTAMGLLVLLIPVVMVPWVRHRERMGAP